MYDVLVELAGELVATVVFGVVALALTALGVVAEVNGVEQFAGGDAVMALWFGALGAVVLYAGVVQLGYRTLLGGRSA